MEYDKRSLGCFSTGLSDHLGTRNVVCLQTACWLGPAFGIEEVRIPYSRSWGAIAKVTWVDIFTCVYVDYRHIGTASLSGLHGKALKE